MYTSSNIQWYMVINTIYTVVHNKIYNGDIHRKINNIHGSVYNEYVYTNP